MNRTFAAVLLAGIAVAPAAGTWAATPKPQHPTARAKTVKFRGPGVDMRWGTVQVTIAVRGKKITDVKALAPKERERSMLINEQAVPMLRQEVLQVQSAHIDVISGATLTSEAFDMSLQGALKKAHLKAN